MDRDEIVHLIAPLAIAFWGEPNRTLSDKKSLRFGNNGGRWADLEKGVWQDYGLEHPSINRGGVLDLVMREQGASNHAEAVIWLEQHGYKPADRPAPARNGQHLPPSDYGAGRDWPADTPEPPAPGKRRIIATYDYRDMSGALIYQVVRFEPKTFLQRQPAPEEPGVWVWGLGAGEFMRAKRGDDWRSFKADRFAAMPAASRERMTLTRAITTGLYKLPEIRDAIETEDALIFIVEGEKDADNLWAAGVPATTASAGAGKWRDEFAETFRGAEVVILPDNDEPGRKHAETIARSLLPIAKSVRILDLAAYDETIPAKGDVSDALAGGLSVETLYAWANAADEYRIEPYRSKFGAIWFNAIDVDTPAVPVEWLIDDLLTCGDRSMLYGRSQSGKSFAAIDMAMAIARGVPFLGHKTKRGGVIYQAGEGTRGIINRFRAYRQHHEIIPGDDLPLAILRSPINLHAGDADTEALIAEIQALAAMMSAPLLLIVIDTLATATSGADENSARDMSPVLARTARLAEACQCHVLLVHHMNAGGEKPRGHTSVFANLDQALEVTFNEAGKIRTIRNTKQKDEAGADPMEFRLKRVVLGTREDGKEISSCVVVPAEEGGNRAAASFALSDQQQIFFRALLNALIDNGVEPPPSLDLPSSIRTVVDYARVKERFARLILPDGDDPAEHREKLKKALGRARTALQNYGIIGADTPWIWWTGRPVRGFSRAQNKLLKRSEPAVPDGE